MWFGTDNGLARFDGRRIQTIQIGDANVDRILALEIAPTEELWIGTSSGAFVFSDDRFHPIANTENTGITAIIFGTSVFLGTNDGSVLRVVNTAAERVFTKPISLTDGTVTPITSLLETSGQILVGTAGRGVLIIQDGDAKPLAMAPSPASVNSLARSDTQQLWLGADATKAVSGIYLTDIDGGKAVRIAAPTATVLALETNESGLWVGTERYGLFQVVAGKLKKSYTFENTSGGLRSDTIFTLFTDREGVLWIGTNRGASRFDAYAPLQQTVSAIPNSNFIRTLSHYGEGRTKFAGSNRGLFEFNGEEWNRVAALGDRTIYAIGWMSSDPESPVVGTPDGMFDVHGKLLLPGDVRAINIFKGKVYAAVYGKGVIDVTGRSRLVFSHEAVTSMGGNVGNMWIGTAGNGLFSYDGTSVKPEASADVLKSGTIWSVSEALDNNGVWIGGQHGVFSFEDGKIEEIFAAEDVRDLWSTPELAAGQASVEASVSKIEHVWAATTSRGVLHARKDDRFGWLVSSISFEQGLPSEKSFAILPTKEGLFIGTNRGVVTVRNRHGVEPKLIATRILSQRVHDLSELKASIPLEYPQNSLLVEVAGQSSRTFPEEFQYAFVLRNSKGGEIARQLSNDSQYAPSDLLPGDYVIEAIAFNRDLLASEPLTVTFSVAKAPFPWTATALGVLLAIAVIALVWAIIERRRIVLRNRELAIARFDLAHEAERERSRIARDLHDQTLADLRDLIMKSDRELPPGTGFRRDIESISTEVRRICEDLSPSVLENVGLIASLEFLLSHTVPEHKFDRGTSTDDDVDLPINVQLQIYRIVQEVLTNIKQHAGASLVEMAISTDGSGSFQMTILNDGTPLTPPEGKLRGGRGIAGIRTRAAFIHATPQWDTSPDGRARFRLSL